MSWIQNRDDYDVKDIRCDGTDDYAAWPEKHLAVIRTKPTTAEAEFTRNQTLVSALHRVGTGVEEDTRVLYETSKVASCAAMLVRVEGELFEDPETGKPLDFSGDIVARLENARRLPYEVMDFIATEIEKATETDPFGLRAAPKKIGNKRSTGKKPAASAQS